MNDTQTQTVVQSLQSLADKLSMEDRYTDAMVAAGGAQAMRAMWTKLRPPTPTPAPVPVTAPESPPE